MHQSDDNEVAVLRRAVDLLRDAQALLDQTSVSAHIGAQLDLAIAQLSKEVH